MPFIQLQFRRDTSANWTINNPRLASGEMGIELDTNLFKIGIGNFWNVTPYGGLRGPTGSTGTIDFSGNTGSILYYNGNTVTGNTGFMYTAGVSGMVVLQGDLIPSVDGIYSLGITGRRWKDIHVGSNSIYIGNSKISSDNSGNISFSNESNEKITFDLDKSNITFFDNNGNTGDVVESNNLLTSNKFRIKTDLSNALNFLESNEGKTYIIRLQPDKDNGNNFIIPNSIWSNRESIRILIDKEDPSDTWNPLSSFTLLNNNSINPPAELKILQGEFITLKGILINSNEYKFEWYT